MVCEMVHFDAKHVSGLRLQNSQKISELTYVQNEAFAWDELASLTHSFTMLKDGSPIACAGLIPLWHGRASAWALIGNRVDRYDMIWIHRRVRFFLDMIQRDQLYRRIEATVLNSFDEGHRWVRLLGFEPEGLMRCYDAWAQDNMLYARVRYDGC